MGWSHTARAGDTMKRIEKACQETAGGGPRQMSNTFLMDGEAYFHEVDCRDQPDHGIRGTIFRMYVGRGGKEMAAWSGTFHINGDGVLLQGPPMWKNAAALFLVVNDSSPIEGPS
jgi:hypothetical protein